MSIINVLRVRKENKIKREIKRQSKRKICCESCKYCYFRGIENGYAYYGCWLRELNFDGDEESIYKYKCDNYKPCKKYKKYLDGKIKTKK